MNSKNLSKNNLYLAIVLFNISWLQSQSEFNKLVDFGLWQQNAFCVLEQNDYLFIGGQSLDTNLVAIEENPFFIKLNLDGVLLDSITVPDNDTQISFDNNARELVVVNNYVYKASSDSKKAYLSRTDLGFSNSEIVFAFSDTLFSLYPPGNMDLIQYQEDELLMLSVSRDNDFNGHSILNHIKPNEGFKVDQYYLRLENISSLGRNILITENGEILVIGNVSPTDIFITRLSQNFEILQTKIISGHIWSGSGGEALIDSDNNIVFTDWKVIIVNNLPVDTATITKIDSDLNLLWNVPSNGASQGLVESHKNDGFISCGFLRNFSDSLSKVGVINKTGIDGENIWTKTIIPVGNVPRRGSLYDVEKSKDGNYIAVGNFLTERISDDNAFSKVWIIKFDENGNLVPDPSVDVISPNNSTNIKVFPNPTYDLLYSEHNDVSDLEYYLFDQSGRLVLEKLNTSAFHTYVLSLDYLTPGIYFMHIKSKNGDINVEKLVLK